MAQQVLNSDNFTTTGLAKNSDLNSLLDQFNTFKTNVTTNYLKSGEADSGWWNSQLNSNFNLYNKPENKNTGNASAYVWNNFYTKGESDGKFALQTSLNNYKTESDGKFALKTQLPNMNNINPTFFSVNSAKTIADQGGTQQITDCP